MHVHTHTHILSLSPVQSNRHSPKTDQHFFFSAQIKTFILVFEVQCTEQHHSLTSHFLSSVKEWIHFGQRTVCYHAA